MNGVQLLCIVGGAIDVAAVISFVAGNWSKTVQKTLASSRKIQSKQGEETPHLNFSVQQLSQLKGSISRSGMGSFTLYVVPQYGYLSRPEHSLDVYATLKYPSEITEFECK